jgi:hypothetical protein
MKPLKLISTVLTPTSWVIPIALANFGVIPIWAEMLEKS